MNHESSIVVGDYWQGRKTGKHRREWKKFLRANKAWIKRNGRWRNLVARTETMIVAMKQDMKGGKGVFVSAYRAEGGFDR